MQLSASSSARRASPACGEEGRQDCEPSSGAASGLSVSQQAEVAWGGACRSAAERLLSRTGSAGTSARPTEKQCAASQKRAAAYLASPPSPSGAVPPPRPATAGMGQAGWLPRWAPTSQGVRGGLTYWALPIVLQSSARACALASWPVLPWTVAGKNCTHSRATPDGQPATQRRRTPPAGPRVVAGLHRRVAVRKSSSSKSTGRTPSAAGASWPGRSTGRASSAASGISASAEGAVPGPSCASACASLSRPSSSSSPSPPAAAPCASTAAASAFLQRGAPHV